MKTLLIAIALACLSGFTGCASVVPKDATEAFFAAEGGYSAALDLAIAYKKQPQCDGKNGPFCSDPAVVNRLRLASDVATPAILNARKIVCTAETLEDGKRVCKSAFDEGIVNGALETARAAVAAFKAATAALPVKK